MFNNLVKSRFYVPVLMGFFLCLLASRRWQQLLSPQVWDEDGTQILYQYIMNGWTTLWVPVNGYLVLVPKLITGASLYVSFLHYPLMSTLIAWLFIAFVGVAITVSPTRLRGAFLCAVAVFLVPTNPEVFGLPLYTFWWAALLLFLLVLWDENASHIGWRITFLLLGGLSSPIIVLVTPLLIARAILYRQHRAEIVIAVLATLIAALQLQFIHVGSSGQMFVLSSVIEGTVSVIFGYFGSLYKLLGDNRLIAGTLLCALLVVLTIQNRRNITTWFLIFLLLGSIALVIARIDINALHPRLAGPRYFFYPYILLSWLFIQYGYAARHMATKVILGVLAIMVLKTTLHSLSRDHDDLDWATHVEACRKAETYAIPIQFDGDKDKAWELVLPGQRCDEWLKRDLF